MDDQDDTGTPSAAEVLPFFRRKVDEWVELWKREIGAELAELTLEEERRLWSLTTELLRSLTTRWGDAFLADLDPFVLRILLGRVARGIEDSIKGHPPPAFLPKGGKGRPSQRSARLMVAGYMRMVKDGMMRDPHPNKTIRDLFGVGDDAVRKWATQPPGYGINVLSRFLPAEGEAQDRAARERHEAYVRRVLANAAREYRRGGSRDG